MLPPVLLDESDNVSDASPRTLFELSDSESDENDKATPSQPRKKVPSAGAAAAPCLVKEVVRTGPAGRQLTTGNEHLENRGSTDDIVETRKRKRKEGPILSFADKVDLVARHESGELISKLCQDFGISKHAIYLILMEKANYKKKGTTSNSKPAIIVPHDQLENAMVLWLTQAVSVGQQLNGKNFTNIFVSCYNC